MQQFWVHANQALSMIARGLGGEYPAILAICERTHAGLVRAKADLLILDARRMEGAAVPNEFWWAKGHEALEQDWARGDFSTWIDRDIEARAFGVQFDFEGLRKILPPEKAALALREISVVSDSNWVSAKAAHQFMYSQMHFNPATAGQALLDHCKLGFVSARTLLMQRSESGTQDRWATEVREWDVPEWFWRNFTKADSSSQDWPRGFFKGRGATPDGRFLMQLTGVHFFKPAIEALAPARQDSHPDVNLNKGGRPRKDWWDDLWCAIWGQIVHGELTPKNQAEIERAMLDWVSDQGESVAESTVKPLAKKAWREWNREAKN